MKDSSTQHLQLLETSDGSQTILNTLLDSTYHSKHGALTESKHVFIAKGLEKAFENGMTNITLLEMGLGTGLNALLSAKAALSSAIRVNYHSLELFPLPVTVWENYPLPIELSTLKPQFEQIHAADWGQQIQLNANFSFTKHQVSLLDYAPETKFDLVFFDAFAPEVQPELWTIQVFQKLHAWMNPNAILTTYCCKGYVRRNMLASGLEVERIPGPPGKREMIRAYRPL